jgi:hypothetical protein
VDRSDLKGADFQHLGDTQALWTCEGKIWLADHAELDDRKALRSANHVAAAGVIDDRWGFGLAIGDQGHDVRLTHGLSHRDFPLALIFALTNVPTVTGRFPHYGIFYQQHTGTVRTPP